MRISVSNCAEQAKNTCPSPKTCPTWKPCYIRALANEANQVKEHVKSAGRLPCNTTLRAPAFSLAGSPEPSRYRYGNTGVRSTRIFGEPQAQIVTRLGGIPLAIELAAPRVRALTLKQIAGHLDDCFRLLVRRSRAGAPRHQT